MGEPSSLSEKQKKLLKDSARPFVSSRRIGTQEAVSGQETPGAETGRKVQVSLQLKEFAVVFFELDPAYPAGDRGYDYQRVMQQKNG